MGTMGVDDTLGTIKTITGITQAKRNQDRQFAFDKEMAAYQNELALQQWNRENEYNSPSNQMKLMREAGINPRLAFANGSPFVQAGSANTSNVPHTQYKDYINQMNLPAFDALNTIQGLRMQQAQIDVLNEQAKEINSRASLNQTKNQLGTIDLMFREGYQRNAVDLLSLKGAALQGDIMFRHGSNNLYKGLGSTPNYDPYYSVTAKYDNGYFNQLYQNAVGQGSYINEKALYQSKMNENYLPYIGDVSKILGMLFGNASKSFGAGLTQLFKKGFKFK